MAACLDINCPDCLAAVTASPDEIVDRDSGLKGQVTRCDHCGQFIDVYYY